jgi:hypothetical protein
MPIMMKQADVGADRRGQAGAVERHRRDAERRRAVDHQVVEADVEQVHHQRGVEVHAGAADAVEEGLVGEGQDHRRDAEHAHAGVVVPSSACSGLAWARKSIASGVIHQPISADEQAGEGRDQQRVPQHLAGAAVLALGVAAGGHRLGAEGDGAEEAADGPEERHAEAERGLRGGRQAVVVEAADHEVVGGVDEELGDHRQHHPGAERHDAADQRALEAEFEEARGLVAEVGQLHGRGGCKPGARRRQASLSASPGSGQALERGAQVLLELAGALRPVAAIGAADLALVVDDEGEGEAGARVLLREGLAAEGELGRELALVCELEDLLRLGVGGDGDQDHAVLAVAAVEAVELRQLLEAGLAPRAPEVEQHDLAAVAGEVDVLAVRGL